jgi:uncharacterized protein YfaS (alpha-2-macroglobulin family)
VCVLLLTPSPSPSPTPSPTPAPKSLSDSVTTNKSSYSGSATVAITVTVKDASNGALLRGASVTVKVINPTGSTVSTFNGITGSAGTVQFNYQPGHSPAKGTWTISSTASLNGYQSGEGQTNFTVN